MSAFNDLRNEIGRHTDLLWLTAVWAVMTWVVNPIGDFPLNDDWTYGVSVKALVEDGRLFFLTEWANKTLVAHVLWGALFCLPFGFSYTALRFSQLTAGLLGGFAVYWLCLELGASRRTSLICALTLLANPLYFQLSNTFMTDVAFTAFCTLALFLLFRAIIQKRTGLLLVGWIVVGFSIWVRELSLMIPAGHAVTRVYQFGLARKNVLIAILPGLVFFLLLIVHQVVMVPALGFPNLDNPRSNSALKQMVVNPLRFLLDIVERTTAALVYVGLFALPILLWFFGSLKSIATHFENKVAHWASGLYLLIAVTSMAYRGKMMPLGKNSLFDFGLGPATLRDQYLMDLSSLPSAPSWFWLVVTILGVAGSLVVVRILTVSLIRVWVRFSSERDNLKQGILAFLLSMILLYSAAIITSGYFDRYLIVYLPLLAAIAVLICGKSTTAIPLHSALTSLLIGSFAIFGSLATHDYLSWNRVRWEIVHDLSEKYGVSPDRIDGGYEVNGTLNYMPEKTLGGDKSWWWVTDDEYTISFGPIPGYTVLETRAFPNYFYGDSQSVFLLKRL